MRQIAQASPDSSNPSATAFSLSALEVAFEPTNLPKPATLSLLFFQQWKPPVSVDPHGVVMSAASTVRKDPAGLWALIRWL